ncbi:MAG: hypothetical protein JRM77_05320 [Nitrososphaerota archaeon]|jgi:hypothetical protein|nr:hypothetical protein [Nitrososphaerota archaeon]
MNLSSPDQIWETSIGPGDLQEAFNYATISLPWTFDRLHYQNKSPKTANIRLLHVLEGVLNQEILQRALKKQGYKCDLDWSNYRESDIFDFEIDGKRCDVKTGIIYSIYDDKVRRKPFSPDLLIRYKSYSGPRWRTFFPIMVPLTQLTPDKMKDTYIFGLAKTEPDLTKRVPAVGDRGLWCSAPYGEAFVFFQNTNLIKAREAAGKGFYPILEYRRTQAKIDEDSTGIEVTIFGEWNKKQKKSAKVYLEPGQRKTLDEEYSSLSCVMVDHPATMVGSDVLAIKAKNNFSGFVSTTVDPKNINDSRFAWYVYPDGFVNLRVPDDYKVYWLGHISFNEFASTFANYPSQFIPNGANMDENTPGRLTPKLKEKFISLDRRRKKAIDAGIKVPWPEFSSLVKRSVVNAGIMVCANKFPRPIGGACYQYPPYALLEGALYVLPRDLHTMSSL